MPLAGTPAVGRAGVAGVVVAGGAGRRMGGVDKAVLVVGGVTLLDRVLGAARPVCDRLVVVGPARPTGVAGVEFAMEAEPGGGPVPAVAAGLAALTGAGAGAGGGPAEASGGATGLDDGATGAGVVLVLAADLPLLRTGDLRRLLAALAGAGAAAAGDAGPAGAGPSCAAAAGAGGRPNPLLAAYRAGELRARAAALGAGARAAALLPAGVVTVNLGLATLNVNRPEDLAAAELALAREGAGG